MKTTIIIDEDIHEQLVIKSRELNVEPEDLLERYILEGIKIDSDNSLR